MWTKQKIRPAYHHVNQMSATMLRVTLRYATCKTHYFLVSLKGAIVSGRMCLVSIPASPRDGKEMIEKLDQV